MTGERFMHHDARGVCGPYTAELVEAGPGSPVYRLKREGCEQYAWVSESGLRKGLRSGLHGPVGWERVTPTTLAA